MRVKILICLLTALLHLTGASAATPVPLVNPSFDQTQAKPEAPAAPDWEPSSPAPGWHVWIGSIARTGQPKIDWANSGGHTGKRCVQLSACKGPVCVIQSVPVRSDRSCEARVWARTSSAQPKCCLSIRFQTTDHRWAAGTHRAFVSRSAQPGDWAQLRVVFRPPDDAAFAVFLLTADGQKPDDTCWFDDASLVEFEPGELVVASCGWIHKNCMPVGKPVETPHVPWAKPWAGKRLKVLFLVGSDHNLREPLELAQRMDIEYDYAFAHNFEPTVYALIDREITDRLRSRHYDVVVLGINAPETMVAELAQQARGLVIIRASNIHPRVPIAADIQPIADDHWVAEPLDALPVIAEKTAGGVAGLHAGRLGEANVIQIQYALRCMCLTPNISFDRHISLGGEYWEAYFQLLARAVMFAGGSRPEVHATLEPTAGAARLRVLAPDAIVSVRYCDKIGRAFASQLSSATGQRPAELTLTPPDAHPAGPSTVLVTLRDAKGRSLGFAATRIEITKPTQIESVRLDRAYYEANQPVLASVVISGSGDVLLEAALTDAYGRLHARTTGRAQAAKATLRLPHGRKLSTLNWLTVRLVRGDAELDVHRMYLYAPMSREEFLDDYQVGTWACSSYMSAYLHPALHQLMREAGITLGIQSASAYPSMLAGRMGLISTAYGRIPGYGRHSSEEHVREQCLNNPAIRRRLPEAARDAARQELGPRPIFGYIRDETSLVRDSLAVDVCACDHCASRFRQWLQARYGTLVKLNAHWHTAFTSWDHIGFSTFHDVRGKNTFAPWVMFRRFQEWTWAEGIKQANRSAREADPTALLALPNTFGAKPFVGRDYWLLAQANAYTMEYPAETRSPIPNRAIFDTLRSFNPDTKHLPWVGYVFEEPIIRFAPWWTAFHGATGCAVYGTMSFFAGKNSWAQIYPALQHTKRGLMYAEELGQLKRGIGKLLMHAKRPTPDIAILWSQASMHVGWALSDQTTNPAGLGAVNPYSQHFYSREAVRQSVIESWRQFDYVCEEQIRQGALSRYKWLMMPAIYAVDDDVAKEIEGFVAGGGTVVADLGVGLTNEAGARLTDGSRITRLFGFSRRGDNLTYDEHKATDLSPLTALGGVREPLLLRGQESIDPLPGTTASQYEDGLPVLICRGHGKGRALLLNGRFPDSPALAGLFEALPPLARLRYETADSRLSGYELVRFETGTNAFMGVLRDWRADGPDDPIQVTLTTAAHVYDVRAGRYAGRADRFRCQLPLGGAGLFALLPYRVRSLGLSMASAPSAGKTATFTCVVHTDAQAGDHVIRVNLHTPGGKLAGAYSQNLIAHQGFAEGHVPFAQDDPAGRWRLVARDVVTGVSAECQLDLTRGPSDGVAHDDPARAGPQL